VINPIQIPATQIWTRERAEADVPGGVFLLLPLREISANNTIVEALACGLPIVANDVEAFPIATKTL
jgi:hypothetical protein